MLKFEPFGHRVLIKRDGVKVKEKTAGGLHIPISAQSEERPYCGVVVAVGPGYRSPLGSYDALPVVIGDTVMYGKYGGTEIELEDEKYVILQFDEILGKIQS